MKKLFFLICFLLVPALGPAQEQSPVQPAKIEALEFREVDIKDILRQLARQYSLNIVFSESVKGLVTVHLNNVSVEQALDSIISVNGFAYTKKENVYKVTTQEEALHEGRQTKLFKLNNADAAKIKETLAKVLSSDGSIEADARSNSIVVTDSALVISKIESMISSLDEITPQVLIECHMIETSLTDTEKLGIDWTTTMKVTGAKRPVTWPFSGGTMPGFTTNDPASTDFAGPNSMPYSVKSDFTLGTLDFSSLQAVFDMLKSRQKTKLVANPRIITLNNQSATINVGKVLSLPTYERNETTGKMDITGWQTYNVGVNLDVTPQISPDGHIKLKLKPNVNSLIGYASVRDGVNEGPITSSRSAQTEVQIKDGESVVIGGLVKEESLTITKKVPFLGDIPFIGALFTRKEVGSDANPTEKTDLLIFVTAHILKEGEPLPSGAQVAQAKDDAQAQGRPFNLQLRDKR